MNSAVHLTEDQIDDYLIGDISAELAAHLESCEDCQLRVAELEAPISSFKDVTLAWSERQSATMPIRSVGHGSTRLHGSKGVWVTAATAALVLGVAMPLAHRGAARVPEQSRGASTAHIQTFSAEREEQIAQDNLMLQAIDREIGAPVRSPSETFGFDIGAQSTRSAHTGTVRD